MRQNRSSKSLQFFFTWLAIAWFIVGCRSATATDSTAAEKLFIPDQELPKGWVVPNHPKPMGPATTGVGDEEDDRFIFFSLIHDKKRLSIAYEFILQFKDTAQAGEWYRNTFPTTYAFTTPETTARLTGPNGLNFQSKRATQFFVGCGLVNEVENKYSCEFIAQYDTFGVEFSSAVSPDVLSIEDFNRLIHVIDRIFTEYLK